MKAGHQNGEEECSQLSTLRTFVRSTPITSNLRDSLSVGGRVRFRCCLAGGHVFCLQRRGREDRSDARPRRDEGFCNGQPSVQCLECDEVVWRVIKPWEKTEMKAVEGRMDLGTKSVEE